MSNDREAERREWLDIKERGISDLQKHHGLTRREAERVQNDAIERAARKAERKRRND